MAATQTPDYWREFTSAFGLAWEQRPSFLTAVAGSVTYAFATVLIGWSFGWLVDVVITPSFDADPDTVPVGLPAAVAVFVGIGLLRSVGVVFRRYFAGKTADAAALHWRKKLGRVLADRSLSWVDTQSSGRLLSATESDTKTAVEALHPMPLAIGAIAMVTLTVAALFWNDPTIAAVATLLVFTTLLFNAFVSKRVNTLAAAVQETLSEVTEIAHESFHGSLLVKTLGIEARESQRLADDTDRLRRRRVRLGKTFAQMEALFSGLPIISLLILTVVGARQVSVGAASAGDVVFAIALFMQLGFPLGVVGFFFESSGRAMAASTRLNSIVESADPDGTSTDAAPPGPDNIGARVELGNVSFRYPMSQGESDRSLALGGTATRAIALDDMTMTIEPGEIVALVGATGSGKSTICSLVSGLYPADDGKVLVDGADISQRALAQRSIGTATAFQEPFLFATDVATNLDLTGRLDPDSLAQAARAASVDDVIDALPDGYHTELGERGVTLSGGQRQRLALARALATKPRLLILDDATSAVDPVVESTILSRIRSDAATTVIIVAQRRSSIERADRVVFINQGRVVAVGPHHELLANDAYRDLVTAYADGDS